MLFKCASCSYSAKLAKDVKIHELRLHSDLRPWKCNNPRWRYSAKVQFDLNRHLKSHETDPGIRKPHACTYKGWLPNDKERTSAQPRGAAAYTMPIFGIMWKKTGFHAGSATSRRTINRILGNHVKSVHQRMVIFTCSYPGCNLSMSFKWTLSKHLKGHDPDPLI